MFPRQHRSSRMSTFEAQRALSDHPLISISSVQNSPARNSYRMEVCPVLNDERRRNTYHTLIVDTREGHNTIDRAHFEILICLTDAVLIIGAVILAISLCITFSTVGLAVFQMYSNRTRPIRPVKNHNE